MADPLRITIKQLKDFREYVRAVQSIKKYDLENMTGLDFAVELRELADDYNGYGNPLFSLAYQFRP